MPTGVTFVDNGNGTLSGTPGSSGIFSIGFSASNDGGKTSASQTFTLTVNAGGQAPAITSANTTAFAVGSLGLFTVTTTGSPLPGLTESGALPTGVTFVDNGNGSGTLSGTPGTGGMFPISFTAANGVSPNTVQAFVLTVSQSQSIAFTLNAPPNAAVNSSFIVAASASSGLAVAFTASGSCSNVGATYTMTASTGTCSVIANQAGNSIFPAAPQVTQTVSATLAAQTINFFPIGTQTVGEAFALNATASSGLPVNFGGPVACGGSISGDMVTPGISGPCTIVASQPGNGVYAAATASQTFTVNGQPQTIVFNPIATQTVGAPLTLTATASSGLPVTYTSSTTGICTVSATNATFLTGGTCTIVASQAGISAFNASYAAAAPVTQSFTVNGQTQTIVFNAIAIQTVGTPLTLTATASSGLPVTYTSSTTGICTVSAATVTFLTGGTCTIVASQAGNSGYSAATPVSQSFTVNPAAAAQTIMFPPIPAQMVGVPFAPSATASSGLPVSFTNTTGTANCLLSAGIVTPLTAGTCTITASQFGNASYLPANPVSQTVIVNGQAQTITFRPIAAQVVGTPLTLTATASSGLPVTFTSSTTGTCTVSGTTVMPIASGTCTIVASQAGSGTFAAATPMTQSFTVNIGAQSIAFTIGAPATAPNSSSFTVAATGGASGNAVTFTSSGVCNNTGATFTMTSATGTCSVIANQAGNANYSAAPQVTQTVTATLAAQIITFVTSAPANAEFGSGFTVAATGGASRIAMTFTSSGVCTNKGANYTMTSGTGVCSVIANQAGNANYGAAPQVTQTVNATLAAQSVTFTTNAPAKAADNGSFSVAAKGGASGNAVTFTSSGACSNTGATYTMTSGTGTCSVIANQAGNTNYSAAPQVAQEVNAAQVAQSITFTITPPAKASYNSSFTVGAAGGASGIPVTFTSAGACSNTGATYTMTSGTGTCSVIANQAGNANYSAAPQVTKTVNAAQIAQAITFTTIPPAKADYNSSFTVAATGGAGGNAVTFTSAGACSNTGATYTMTSGTGTCSVIANQAGDTNYSASPQVTKSVNAALVSQTIAFPALPKPERSRHGYTSRHRQLGVDGELYRDIRPGYGQWKHTDHHGRGFCKGEGESGGQH